MIRFKYGSFFLTTRHQPQSCPPPQAVDAWFSWYTSRTLLASCPHVHFKGLGLFQSFETGVPVKCVFVHTAAAKLRATFSIDLQARLWLCTLIAPNLSTHHDLIIKLLRLKHSLLRQQRRSSLSSEQAAKS
jgi:hypothetical protein